VEARAEVEGDEQRAHDRVRGGEARGAAVSCDDVVDVDRERRDREHRARFREAEDQVVGVEPVRVEREAGPRPPDRHEQADEAREHGSARVAGEGGRELRDRRHENEVEVELEPGRVALLARIGGRAQARRLEPECRRASHRP
jgi:hypothetical protein